MIQNVDSINSIDFLIEAHNRNDRYVGQQAATINHHMLIQSCNSIDVLTERMINTIEHQLSIKPTHYISKAA